MSYHRRPGALKINRPKIRQEEKLDGKFLVSTSDDGLSGGDVVAGYKQLWQFERVNRHLKHTVDVRPLPACAPAHQGHGERDAEHLAPEEALPLHTGARDPPDAARSDLPDQPDDPGREGPLLDVSDQDTWKMPGHSYTENRIGDMVTTD